MNNERYILEELIYLERRRSEGWIIRDRNILLDLMDEDFVEINYFGRLTRSQLLEELFPNLILQQFEMDDFKLLASEKNIAILSYRVHEKLTYKDEKVDGVFHVTAVYRSKGQRWSLIIWQITPFMQ